MPAGERCPPRYTGLLQLREFISLHRGLLTLVHEREASFQSPALFQLTPHEVIIVWGLLEGGKSMTHEEQHEKGVRAFYNATVQDIGSHGEVFKRHRLYTICQKGSPSEAATSRATRT